MVQEYQEYQECQFINLIGQSLISITKEEYGENTEKLIFKTNKNETYHLHHFQDCCESVYIEDICGDLDDLLNTPILQAEEITNTRDERKEQTWTFYKLSTIKGGVTIRWVGRSNGYYSETVSFSKILKIVEFK